jgi:Na+-translocating ferredoxin:NAD+ oxidoreductase RnfD subunit
VERIEELEKQVKMLSSGVRFGIITAILILTSNYCHILFVADKQRRLLDDLLQGEPLPLLTQFIFDYSGYLVTGTILLSILAIVILFIFKHRVWSIPIGILSAILTCIAIQMTSRAIFEPFLKIINKMG